MGELFAWVVVLIVTVVFNVVVVLLVVVVVFGVVVIGLFVDFVVEMGLAVDETTGGFINVKIGGIDVDVKKGSDADAEMGRAVPDNIEIILDANAVAVFCCNSCVELYTGTIVIAIMSDRIAANPKSKPMAAKDTKAIVPMMSPISLPLQHILLIIGDAGYDGDEYPPPL